MANKTIGYALWCGTDGSKLNCSHRTAPKVLIYHFFALINCSENTVINGLIYTKYSVPHKSTRNISWVFDQVYLLQQIFLKLFKLYFIHLCVCVCVHAWSGVDAWTTQHVCRDQRESLWSRFLLSTFPYILGIKLRPVSLFAKCLYIRRVISSSIDFYALKFKSLKGGLNVNTHIIAASLVDWLKT